MIATAPFFMRKPILLCPLLHWKLQHSENLVGYQYAIKLLVLFYFVVWVQIGFRKLRDLQALEMALILCNAQSPIFGVWPLAQIALRARWPAGK